MIKLGGFKKRTVRDVPLRGRTVLVRADYNVPLNDSGEIADDYRIISSLPTLRYLLENDCKIVVCSHLGRPEGKVNEKFSLEPVATHLEKLLSHPVKFIPESVGDRVFQHAKRLRERQVILLENLRFYPEEEANDQTFAKRLATDTAAEYFVQDGFGVVHRAHASTSAITQFLPSVAGLLLEKEFSSIRAAIDKPERPLVAVLGGAKISDKIAIIEKFVAIADTLIIGGAMANTFLKAKGYDIGKSVYEKGLGAVVEEIYRAAEKKVGTEHVDDFILLPTDVAVAGSADNNARRVTVGVGDVAAEEMILDVGPETIIQSDAVLASAKTIVWNGTLGFAELSQFSYGSARAALAVASNPSATSVIGGGDTADFVLKWGDGSAFTHVSTGGGASLDLMAGAPMPGIEALLDASIAESVH